MKCCFYHHFPQHNLTLNKATKQECLPNAASCLIQVAGEQANLSRDYAYIVMLHWWLIILVWFIQGS